MGIYINGDRLWQKRPLSVCSSAGFITGAPASFLTKEGKTRLISRRQLLADIIYRATSVYIGMDILSLVDSPQAFGVTLTATDLYPCRPGLLSNQSKRSIWKIFESIGEVWNMGGVDPNVFSEICDLKTSSNPSYLKEYQNTIEVFHHKQNREPKETILYLLRYNGKERRFLHIRDHVIKEFLRLHLACGGFKQFGFSTYRGFPSGHFGYRKREA